MPSALPRQLEGLSMSQTDMAAPDCLDFHSVVVGQQLHQQHSLILLHHKYLCMRTYVYVIHAMHGIG